jgi:hypothetical protein
MEMLVTCTRCKVEKPATLEYFKPHKGKLNKLDSWCTVCRNEYRTELRRKNPPKDWNVPEEDLEKFRVAKQYGECIICGNPATTVDHDHLTGKIRGPLCQNCNLGLGHFKDNPELLELAALYLRGKCSCGSCDTYWGGNK